MTDDTTAELPTEAVATTEDETLAVLDMGPIAEPEENISVYAQSISPGNFDGDELTFNIIFSVGINNDEGTKTYQVVKRIAVSKAALATSAAQQQPAAVVENKTVDNSTAKRFRILAGLA